MTRALLGAVGASERVRYLVSIINASIASARRACTRTQINSNLNGAKANSAGRDVRACIARDSKLEES